MAENRRNFLKKSALLGLAGIAGSLGGSNTLEKLLTINGEAGDEGSKIVLPKLPYSYDALEPFIDKQTMEIHHTKHHQAYIDKLNTVSPDKFDATLSEAENCKKINDKSEALLRNNLGGHYNHSLFWTLMQPNKGTADRKPGKMLAEAIDKNFKSHDEFKKEFSDKALKLFGSGWCWLIVDENRNLKITTTPNQDNPLMQVAADKGRPVLALDVWEHAYYLKHQNKRADYISNWWNVVNWDRAEALYKG